MWCVVRGALWSGGHWWTRGCERGQNVDIRTQDNPFHICSLLYMAVALACELRTCMAAADDVLSSFSLDMCRHCCSIGFRCEQNISVQSPCRRSISCQNRSGLDNCAVWRGAVPCHHPSVGMMVAKRGGEPMCHHHSWHHIVYVCVSVLLSVCVLVCLAIALTCAGVAGDTRARDYDSLEQSIILQTLLIRFQESPKLISHPSDSDGCEIQLWTFWNHSFRNILFTVFRRPFSAARGTS